MCDASRLAVVVRRIGTDDYRLKVDMCVSHCSSLSSDPLNFLRSSLLLLLLCEEDGRAVVHVRLSFDVRPSMLTRRRRRQTKERTLFFLSERTTNRRRRRRRRTSSFFSSMRRSVQTNITDHCQIHLHPSFAMIKDE